MTEPETEYEKGIRHGGEMFLHEKIQAHLHRHPDANVTAIAYALGTARETVSRLARKYNLPLQRKDNP